MPGCLSWRLHIALQRVHFSNSHVLWNSLPRHLRGYNNCQDKTRLDWRCQYHLNPLPTALASKFKVMIWWSVSGSSPRNRRGRTLSLPLAPLNEYILLFLCILFISLFMRICQITVRYHRDTRNITSRSGWQTFVLPSWEFCRNPLKNRQKYKSLWKIFP